MRRRHRKNGSKLKSWDEALRLLLTGLMGIGIGAYADLPMGLIGGANGDSTSYGGLIYSGNGSVTTIHGLPLGGEMDSAAINKNGYGIIGGYDGSTNGYAAFVAPNGTITQLPVTFTGGSILSASINKTNQALIGGSIGFNSGGYAAYIDSAGNVSPLSPGAAAIESVSLNNSGFGLIGGEGSGGDTNEFYAAFTSEGAITQVINTPTGDYGIIFGASINESGQGIIAGQGPGSNMYAAFVTYNDAAITTTLSSPGGSGTIYSAAINDSGLALIGGQDGFNAYASYATFGSDAVSDLFQTPFAGQINSVALNKSGAGILGGVNNSDIYAALVTPSGGLTSILPESLSGQIYSVAINDAGIGLVGGYHGSDAYAALVAPNGALTLLSLPNQSAINAVALNNVANSATPTSSGPYLSAFYTQLAAASALEWRFVQQNRIWSKTQNGNLAQADVTDPEETFASNKIAHRIPSGTQKEKTAPKPKQNSIWIAPFGDYVHLKSQGSIPNYTNEIGGVLLAYDHQASNYMVGASLGYAFNYIHYSESLGHGKIQEEMACFYGAYSSDHFRFNGVIWGGYYQFWNTRHTLTTITSKGNTHGWLLSPHVEFASPWAMSQNQLYFVEPFVMVDWVNSWLHGYTETGVSGLNLIMANQYGSLLQSEAGLRFYEKFQFGWGDFCLEEKASYINQAPFNLNSATTSFVSSASTFPIAIASTKLENLAALQLIGSFVPKNKSYPFGGFSAQVTGNGSYQSYFLSLFSGMDF